jgi:hypothetical protein
VNGTQKFPPTQSFFSFFSYLFPIFSFFWGRGKRTKKTTKDGVSCHLPPVTFAKLNAFSNMEALLRPHLQELARSEGVQPKNPQDVRQLLDELAGVWPTRER